MYTSSTEFIHANFNSNLIMYVFNQKSLPSQNGHRKGNVDPIGNTVDCIELSSDEDECCGYSMEWKTSDVACNDCAAESVCPTPPNSNPPPSDVEDCSNNKPDGDKTRLLNHVIQKRSPSKALLEAKSDNPSIDPGVTGAKRKRGKSSDEADSEKTCGQNSNLHKSEQVASHPLFQSTVESSIENLPVSHSSRESVSESAFMTLLGMQSRKLPERNRGVKTEVPSGHWIDNLNHKQRRSLIVAGPHDVKDLWIKGRSKVKFPTSAAIDLTSAEGRFILSKIPGAIVDPLSSHLVTVLEKGYSGLWPSVEFCRSIMKKRHSEINISTINPCKPAKKYPETYIYLWQENLPKERKKMEGMIEKEKQEEEWKKANAILKKAAAERARKWQLEKSTCFVDLGPALKVSKCQTCGNLVLPPLQKKCYHCRTAL